MDINLIFNNRNIKDKCGISESTIDDKGDRGISIVYSNLVELSIKMESSTVDC